MKTLLRGYSKLDYENLRVIVAGGDMPYYTGYSDKIKNLAKKLGVSENVVFTGFISDDEVHQLFERSELIVIPYSVSVLASGVLSLAIQHKKPTIITDTRFFREEVDDSEVLFTAIDDV